METAACSLSHAQIFPLEGGHLQLACLSLATAFGLSPRTGPLELPCSQSLYPKVVQFFAGSQLRPQPARLPTTARPGLGGIFRISILREDLGVRTALGPQLSMSGAKSMQALVKSHLFSSYFATQFGNQLLMKVPELICRHRFQIAPLHFSEPDGL
jgi:hypothetical protein